MLEETLLVRIFEKIKHQMKFKVEYSQESSIDIPDSVNISSED